MAATTNDAEVIAIPRQFDANPYSAEAPDILVMGYAPLGHLCLYS